MGAKMEGHWAPHSGHRWDLLMVRTSEHVTDSYLVPMKVSPMASEWGHSLDRAMAVGLVRRWVQSLALNLARSKELLREHQKGTHSDCSKATDVVHWSAHL